MYAFYVVRGHKLEDLEGLSVTQKLFYTYAMLEYYDNIAKLLPGEEEIEDGQKIIKKRY